jgi:hypothetical protein
MGKSVSDAYPHLWHYTTGAGLTGIVTSQELWATNIFFLNDAEEFTGFFDRKLLHLLKNATSEGVAEMRKSAGGRDFLDSEGGMVNVELLPERLTEILRKVTLALPVYVTSFCYTQPTIGSEDGLLSQWRGYGQDGGYAVVFDTKKLNELMGEEQRLFVYSYGHWGDVDYFKGESTDSVSYEETQEWEGAIRSAIVELIAKRDWNSAGQAFFNPILSLATRHKHHGFSEEREVRIACMPAGDDVLKAHKEQGLTGVKKPVYFTTRGGILVPHIALFQRPSGEKAILPITKIIIGPHPDKAKRKKSVELLLEQFKVDAQVTVSDIPYLGH